MERTNLIVINVVHWCRDRVTIRLELCDKISLSALPSKVEKKLISTRLVKQVIIQH
jgi:hypothetical protein